MSVQPAVSVIVTAWNRSDYILDALVSIVGQRFDGVIETVVVDDGSTDDTRERVSQWIAQNESESRTFRLVAKAHTGIADTVRTGMLEAHGEFVAHLASDDRWAPDRVARALEIESHFGGAATVFTNWAQVDESGKPISDDGWQTTGRPRPPQVIWDPTNGRDIFPTWWRYRLLLGGALLWLPASALAGDRMLPAEAAEEDFWFSLCAFLSGPIVYVDEPTYVVRLHPEQISAQRRVGPAGDEQRQIAGLEAQIALVEKTAPAQKRLLAALRVQRGLTEARFRRDQGSVMGALAAAARTVPDAFVVPPTAGRIAATVIYCLVPRLYLALKRSAT